MSFGDRLTGVFDSMGGLCLGIDPHAPLLAEWGLPDSGAGAREFGLRCVDAAVDRVGIVKPQVAFFERHGSAGYAALESVLAAARAAGLFAPHVSTEMILSLPTIRGIRGSLLRTHGPGLFARRS